MFKNLRDILTTDCEVLKFDDGQFVYPIFKNGSSSLNLYGQKNNLEFLKNKQLSKIKKIIVFLRSPKERFVSGIHTFFYLSNQLINEQTLKKIENFDVINRHFIPQYIWLFHLHKYFAGVIDLRPVSLLYDMIPNRDGPWTVNSKTWKPITQKEKKKILSIEYEKYIDIDEKIIKKYLNRVVELKDLIREFKI